MSAPTQTSIERQSATRLLVLPLVPIAVLSCISLAPGIKGHAALMNSIWAAALLLVVWAVVLLITLRRLAHSGSIRPRTIRGEIRSQHYIQALVQLSLYAYWGYYWPQVYEHAWLIVAQLAFAYAFDMLLTWSRRETYVLGFGAFPIVFSTNLFLWFKDDWFYLQFAVIAVGLLGKEFVRWQRDGRSVHIFNPSAFTLALFSITLIATDASDLTWAQDIASTLTLAPHFYVFMFAIGLVVMYFFSITPITFAAAATLFSASGIYFALTGAPYFLDSEIPAAVFLGLHLLVTDPSTSPRSNIGKVLFGILYGLGVFTLYGLLTLMEAPTFYDKLMCVPLLNLAVQRIDRLANFIETKLPSFDSLPKALGSNVVHMTVWIGFFFSMTALGKTDGPQVGDSVPFWEKACSENRPNACARLNRIEHTYCKDNSAWACNELGVRYSSGTQVAQDPLRARQYFAKACELRFQVACVNLFDAAAQLHAPPKELDLRLLLRERGLNLMSASSSELQARACKHGWSAFCSGTGMSQ